MVNLNYNVQNRKLKLYQEVNLTLLESEYIELKELINLFSKHELEEKINYLSMKGKNYDKKYKKQIKNAERLLKNTEKRIDYNLNRCDLIN